MVAYANAPWWNLHDVIVYILDTPVPSLPENNLSVESQFALSNIKIWFKNGFLLNSCEIHIVTKNMQCYVAFFKSATKMHYLHSLSTVKVKQGVKVVETFRISLIDQHKQVIFFL